MNMDELFMLFAYRSLPEEQRDAIWRDACRRDHNKMDSTLQQHLPGDEIVRLRDTQLARLAPLASDCDRQDSEPMTDEFPPDQT